MAYRIQYGSVGPVKTAISRNYFALTVVLFLLVCTVTVTAAHLMGAQWAKELLFPGDPEVTAGALEQFVARLQQGSPVMDAITFFCREVIANGA